jgi:uncharacterized protein
VEATVAQARGDGGVSATDTLASIADRVAALDWREIIEDLNNRGCAIAKCILTPKECQSLADMYGEDSHFRSRVVMARHGFGRGVILK